LNAAVRRDGDFFESIRGQGTWFTLTFDAAPGTVPNERAVSREVDTGSREETGKL
jgi:hypothetical protein